MKIYVEIDQEQEILSEVAKEIAKIWPEVSMLSGGEVDLPKGAEGLLVVGNGINRPMDGLLILENVVTEGLSIEQIVLQVNAKLGKMLASDLIRSKTSSRARDTTAKISRRDLFSGIRSIGVFQSYSDAPVIYNDICEARFGCSKCVEVCPTQALNVVNGTLTLNEQECQRHGLCASVCPVSAIQLPEFSDSQFLGLVYGIIRTSPSIPKTLVLTCDKNSVHQEPWIFVEQVKDVGEIGSRHVAIAASSGIDKILVYCADGACLGKEKARMAIQSIGGLSQTTNETEPTIIRFLEGDGAKDEIRKICLLPKSKSNTLFIPGRNSWPDYVRALSVIATPEGLATGLGLTNLDISESCTLCEVCTRYCPHSALRVNEGALEFDSSKCTGCGYCSKVCPEHSITLSSLERFSDLHNRVVFSDEIVRCERCKRPIGSTKYLRNIERLLGAEHQMLKYCDACKQQIAIERLFGHK